LAAIRAIISNRAVDPNLVDELAARVWYAVVRDEGRLLARFDPGRGCTLTTYLALLAKDEASRLFRSERRRRRRETAVATSDATPPHKTAAQAAERITLAEFAATLTPAEKMFYEEITATNGHHKNGQTANGNTANGQSGHSNQEGQNGHDGENVPAAQTAAGAGKKTNSQTESNGRSQANEWQLNHRIRRKLVRFLTT
jgi:hypothetical protein